MKNSIKKFRLNVVMTYYDKSSITTCRENLHPIFKGLAWLYNIDVAIICDHQATDDSGLPSQEVSDLVYFRSTTSTRLDSKDLRKLIAALFDHSDLWSAHNIDLFLQLQKALPEYPFPEAGR